MRKIVDDQIEKDQLRLTVPAIYDSIKKSNSSLNRRPKRVLEDSLERVVELVKVDVFGDDEEDSVEGDFEGLEEQQPPPQVRLMHERNGMSKKKLTRFRNPTVSIRASSACGILVRRRKHQPKQMALIIRRHLHRRQQRNENGKIRANLLPSDGKPNPKSIDHRRHM